MNRASRTLLVVCTLGIAALATLFPASAAPPLGSPIAEPANASPATQAIEYVASTQAVDGSFFEMGQAAAGSGGLADTLVAVAVDEGLGGDALDAALARLAELAPSATSQPAYTARIVMAIVASGLDPRSFGGVDYVARLEGARAPAGYWEIQNYANALAALGWVAAGRELALESVLWTMANQCADGGWGFMTACSSRSDVDTTALTLNALVAGGVDTSDPSIVRARQFLIDAQNADGGFGDRPDAETNANSTGLALSAIAALDEAPTDAPWNLGAGRDPLSELLALQTADGGFLWKASAASMIDNYATVQALPGVAGVAYPVPPRAEADDRCPAHDRSRRDGRCLGHRPRRG